MKAFLDTDTLFLMVSGILLIIATPFLFIAMIQRKKDEEKRLQNIFHMFCREQFTSLVNKGLRIPIALQ